MDMMILFLRKTVRDFGQIFVIFLIPNFAFANSVYLRSREVPELRYQVLLQKHNGISYVDHWHREHPTVERVFELQDHFERAQRTLLGQGVEVAVPIYSTVADMALTSDWKPPEREIIAQAFFRLASFEVNKEAREKFLIKAIHFDESIEPPSEFFSPQLIEEHREIRSKQLPIVWSPKFKDMVIFINGRRMDTSRPIAVMPGPKRVTFVSNFSLPHTIIADAQKLQDARLDPRTLISGTCNEPQWTIENQQSVAVMKDCILRRDGTKLGDISEPNTKKVGQLSLPPMTESTPIFKKPLFWIITGAVVTAAVIVIQNQKKESETRPTYGEGL